MNLQNVEIDDENVMVLIGKPFQLNYRTSAISYPKFSLSDGLIIIKDIDTDYNTMPGASIGHALLILPTTLGKHIITKTVRSPIPSVKPYTKKLIVNVVNNAKMINKQVGGTKKKLSKRWIEY